MYRALLATALLCAACTQPRARGEPTRAATEPPAPSGPHAAAPAGTARRFALVELFTSEGCSSCPPADALLGSIVGNARETGEPVYALSFHVDYWNYLGWRDPFSDEAYSARQREYGYAFHLSGIYTPQAVIGGTDEVLGSDASAVARELDKALSAPSTVEVTLSLSPVGDDANAIDVTYTASPAEAPSVFDVALVERDKTDAIASGENRGRTITHQNVVRVLQTVPLGARGTVRLTIPAGVRLDRASVIGWAQRDDAAHESLAVLGGAAVDLRP